MEWDESLVLRIGSPGTHLVLALASDSYEFTGESRHFRRRGWVLGPELATSVRQSLPFATHPSRLHRRKSWDRGAEVGV